MRTALNNLILTEIGELDIDQLIDLFENLAAFAKINSAAQTSSLSSLSRRQMAVTAKATKTAETTREALILFFSDECQYIRDLLEDTIVDGFDALSKDALKQFLQEIGWLDRIVPIPYLGGR